MAKRPLRKFLWLKLKALWQLVICNDFILLSITNESKITGAYDVSFVFAATAKQVLKMFKSTTPFFETAAEMDNMVEQAEKILKS